MAVFIKNAHFSRITQEYSGRILILEGVDGDWKAYTFTRGSCTERKEAMSFEGLGFSFSLKDCKREHFIPQYTNAGVKCWSIPIYEGDQIEHKNGGIWQD